jgi:hypothetical protein
LGTEILPDDVDKTTVGVTNDFLLHNTGQEIALLNDDGIVFWAHPLITAFEINALWNN